MKWIYKLFCFVAPLLIHNFHGITESDTKNLFNTQIIPNNLVWFDKEQQGNKYEVSL